MNSISNDFVTIEFKGDQKEKAEYCLKLLNSEPELYKGLLNGKTSICSEEFTVYEDDDETIGEIREINKYNIIKSIMNMNGVADKAYPFYDSTNFDIYNIIKLQFFGNPNGYYEEKEKILAYDYFKKTKDFKYLKKYLYEDGITDNDVMEMCVFNVTNYYKDLLREKIHSDILLLSNNNFFTKDFPRIMYILYFIYNDISFNTINASNISEEQANMMRNSTIPKIDEKQFENLVVRALKYIDPTSKLLDEYLKCLDENRIKASLIPDRTYFFRYNNDYGIRLYKYGNIEDVISLVHELGHMHYTINNNHTSKCLFDEYPSIYYELKCAEYLTTVGFSKEEVHNAMFFRLYDNTKNMTYIVPIMQSVHVNIGKDVEDYDLSAFDNIIDMFENGFNLSPLKQRFTEEEIKQMEETLNERLMSIKLGILLNSSTDLIRFLKYIIGTFFSKYAISNLNHKNVLRILDDIASNEYSLSDVFKMHGIDSNYEESKNKIKVNRK